MFSKARINEIITLENQYKEKKKNLVSGAYDAKIKLLLDHSQRKVVEQILKQEKYQRLAKFHNDEYINDFGEKVVVDLHELSLQANRNTVLKELLVPWVLFSIKGLINDFCREVEVALLNISDPTTAIKQEKLIREEELSKAEAAYQSAISSALKEINSISSMQELQCRKAEAGC